MSFSLESASSQATHVTSSQPGQDIVSKSIKSTRQLLVQHNSVKTNSLSAAQTDVNHDVNYAALRFTGRKAARGRNKEVKNEECVYSQVKTPHESA